MSLATQVQIVVLSILVATRYSYSQGIETCRPIPLIENIDLDRLASGVWYAAQIGDAGLASRKCVTYIGATVKLPGGTMVVIWEIMRNRKKVLRWNKFAVDNTSYLKTQVIGGGNEGYWGDEWVVSTDYESYAIFYYCIPGTEDGIVFTLTRNRPATEEQIRMMQNILKNLGFKLNNLYTVNQEHCNN